MTRGQLKLLQKEMWQEKIMASMPAPKDDGVPQIPEIEAAHDSSSSSGESDASESGSGETCTPKKGKKQGKTSKKKAKAKKGKKSKKTKKSELSPGSTLSTPKKGIEVECPTEATWSNTCTKAHRGNLAPRPPHKMMLFL